MKLDRVSIEFLNRSVLLAKSWSNFTVLKEEESVFRRVTQDKFQCQKKNMCKKSTSNEEG